MDESENISILQKALEALQDRRLNDAWSLLKQSDRSKHPQISFVLGEICCLEMVPEARLSDAKEYYGDGFSQGDATCMAMLSAVHTIEGDIPKAVALWQEFLEKNHGDKDESDFNTLMIATYIKRIIETDATWHTAIAQLFHPYKKDVGDRVIDLFQSDFRHRERENFLCHIRQYLRHAFLAKGEIPIERYSEYARKIFDEKRRRRTRFKAKR